MNSNSKSSDIMQPFNLSCFVSSLMTLSIQALNLIETLCKDLIEKFWKMQKMYSE